MTTAAGDQARAGIADLEAQLDLAATEIADLTRQCALKDDQIDRLEAECARLEDIIGANAPTVAAFTYVGACPPTDGYPTDVPAKWGTPVGLRGFTAGGLSTAPRPSGVDRCHWSWKPALGVAITKAQIASALTNAVAGDIVTVWHETDVKYRNGSFTRAQTDQAIALSVQFHELVDEMRTAGDIPAVETCDVYAAWMFMSNSGLYPGTVDNPRTAAFYLSRHCSDLIGIDCDGISNTSAYPDFTSAATNTLAAVAQYGRRGWTVPEWMHYRINGDTSGNQRATWFRTQGAMFLGCVPRPRSLLVFDTNFEGRVQVIQPGTPEFAVVKDLMVDGRLAQ